MSRPTNNMSEELFKVDGKTSVGETLPLALQHVVAMIVGCVTPAIIVAGVAGLSEQDSVILIQGVFNQKFFWCFPHILLFEHFCHTYRNKILLF